MAKPNDRKGQPNLILVAVRPIIARFRPLSRTGSVVLYGAGVSPLRELYFFTVQGRQKMKAAMKGVVHGKVIELDQEPGLPDGQEVSVTVEPVSSATSPTSPEALESLRQ